MASTNFLPGRGCFYKIETGGAGPAGLYAIEGFQSPASAPVLFTGVNIQDTEMLAPVRTLSGRNVIYSFGNDFGTVSIMGEILLGEVGKDNVQGMSTVIDFFKENRLHKRGDNPITVSAGKGYKIYLTGLTFAAADINYNIQPFAFVGVLADPPE